MNTFHRNKKFRKQFFTDLYLLDPEVPEFESPAIVASCSDTLSTCNMPVAGDTWHIYRKGGNETGQHLV